MGAAAFCRRRSSRWKTDHFEQRPTPGRMAPEHCFRREPPVNPVDPMRCIEARRGLPAEVQGLFQGQGTAPGQSLRQQFAAEGLGDHVDQSVVSLPQLTDRRDVGMVIRLARRKRSRSGIPGSRRPRNRSSEPVPRPRPRPDTRPRRESRARFLPNASGGTVLHRESDPRL